MSKTEGPKSYHFPHFLPETPKELPNPQFQPLKVTTVRSSPSPPPPPPGPSSSDPRSQVLLHSRSRRSKMRLGTKLPSWVSEELKHEAILKKADGELRRSSGFLVSQWCELMDEERGRQSTNKMTYSGRVLNLVVLFVGRQICTYFSMFVFWRRRWRISVSVIQSILIAIHGLNGDVSRRSFYYFPYCF